VGVLLAIVTWNLAFLNPINLFGGLDQGWEYGLYAAAERGLHFGTDIVFTYGPLGFLRFPMLWYGGLASLAFLYEGALHVLLAVTIVYALRQPLGLIGAALAGFVVLVLTPSADIPTVLATGWCLAALSRDPPWWAVWVVAIGGAVLGAAETLVEGRTGPVIVAICLITLVARQRWRQLIAFAGTLVLAGGVLWFASGQSLGNVPDFVSHELQIVSGYSEAMGVPGNGRIWVAILVLVGLVVGVVAVAGPARRLRIGAGLVIGLVAFALFKEGFVRADAGHSPIFFMSALVLVAVAASLGPHRRLSVLAGLATLIVINAVLMPRPQLSDFDPVKRINLFVTQSRTLASSRRQDIVSVFAGAFMAVHYRLPASMVDLLRGHTVHLDPWDTAAAWVYHLDWDPAPVFQGYSAYTRALDELNARALSSARGPQRVLRENTVLVDAFHGAAGIDGRLGVWDPPAEALAMMCNFEPQMTTLRWQVLARVPDRCGDPALLSSQSVRPGQAVTVPAAGQGQAIFARVHGLAVSGIEKIEALLFRAHLRRALINGTLTARIVPGTAQDGLLFDVAPDSDYPAPFRLSPDVRTISFRGTSGPYRIDLYRMSVTPIGTATG
jgi:hypothetical protein